MHKKLITIKQIRAVKNVLHINKLWKTKVLTYGKNCPKFSAVIITVLVYRELLHILLTQYNNIAMVHGINPHKSTQ